MTGVYINKIRNVKSVPTELGWYPQSKAPNCQNWVQRKNLFYSYGCSFARTLSPLPSLFPEGCSGFCVATLVVYCPTRGDLLGDISLAGTRQMHCPMVCSQR